MMKKAIVSTLLAIIVIHFAQAQTKVFKEVSDEISSQFKVIRQDNALVGYLSFARLEKASEDSFNYRISIMDENLNDIGKVEFKEEGLTLYDISFEQDILCLGYIKSNFIGNVYKSRKSYKDALANAETSVFTQFLNLDGKILKTNSFKAEPESYSDYSAYENKTPVSGYLKQSIQLKNVSRKGFVLFYGDKFANHMMVFNTAGEPLWKKRINVDGAAAAMLISGRDIYFLWKNGSNYLDAGWHWGPPKVNFNEGNYQLLGYTTSDTTIEMRYPLVDAHSNQLKVLSFDNDPITGKPYLAGNIISQEHRNDILNGRQWSHGPYSGVFTVNVNGPNKQAITQVCSYWSDGSQESITERGRFVDNNDNEAYSIFAHSFKDYDGNTYFVGSELVKKPKWGSIASSVALSPLFIVSPAILMFSGTSKCKISDVILIKQNAKGYLSVANTIETDHTNFHRAFIPLSYYYNRNFYRVTNAETKTNYVIIDDKDNIYIYNAAKKKVARTIPHKDGGIKTEVFPAKEGYIMVSEYNKKEKYTKVSIEAL
jgi:hypothetical protein